MANTIYEKIIEIVKSMDEEKARELLNLLIKEAGEKMQREPKNKEEILGAIIYLIDKYQKLQRYIPIYEFDGIVDQVEYFSIWDAVKKIGETLFKDEKPQPQPQPQPVIIQDKSDIPGWIWIAVIAFMLIFLTVVLIVALK